MDITSANTLINWFEWESKKELMQAHETVLELDIKKMKEHGLSASKIKAELTRMLCSSVNPSSTCAFSNLNKVIRNEAIAKLVRMDDEIFGHYINGLE